MNRKTSSQSGATVRGKPRLNAAAAMERVMSGYRDEAELYARLRRLTWSQRETLSKDRDLGRFRDLLEEKEDILRMIGQIDEEMKGAKGVLLAGGARQCPGRRNLEAVLDRLADTIEEIRIVEGANASLLEAVPAR